jgi:hypothetical protein
MISILELVLERLTIDLGDVDASLDAYVKLSGSIQSDKKNEKQKKVFDPHINGFDDEFRTIQNYCCCIGVPVK